MSSWPPPERPPSSPFNYISQTRYMPGLDGLRALAVIAVMIYHADHEWLSGGFLGVEVFFVISGYLITLLLIGEHERTGGVSILQFWKRRFRRLLPALYVMMAFLALYLALWNRRPAGRTRGDFVGGLLYGSNWYQIVVGQSYTAAEAFAPLRHLWSLAVEEQFYLVWPIVMLVILRKGRERLPRVGLWLLGLSALIAIVTAVLFVGGDVADECGLGSSTNGFTTIFGRCININDALYLNTFSRAGGLMLGAGFAMVWRPLALLRGPMRTKAHRLDLIALLGLVTLVLLSMRLSLSSSGSSFGIAYDAWLFRGGFFVTGLATLTIIAAVVHRRSFAGRILGNPLLAWIGTRSYGLYLYHWPIYQIIRKFAGCPLTLGQFILAMVITVPVTELSYRVVEAPIRTGRLKAWMRGEQRSRAASGERQRRGLVPLIATMSVVTGFAGVSIAVAKNVCVGDVECSVEAADQASAGPTPQSGPSVIVTMPQRSTTTTDASADSAEADPSTTADEAATADASVTTAPTGETTVASTAAGTESATTTTSPPSVEGATTLPPATTASTVVTEPTVVASTAATAEPTPVATAAPSLIQPIALGESVMLGAKPNLEAGGFYVDALKGRQGPEMAALLENLRSMSLIGQVVVIQIGTNGTITNGDLQRIMAQLTPDLTPVVVFLTVRVPKAWQDGNNELIRALPATYSNVRVVDWQMASMSIEICDDGTHIACGATMAQYYTNLIFDSIGRPDLKR